MKRAKKHPPSMTANECLRKAIARRDRFVAQHPHVKAYQAEIDALLDKAGNHQDRLAVLGMLMQGRLMEMQFAFNKLKKLMQ